MRNLYLIQTNKPSRLRYTYGNNYALSKEYLSWRFAHHIYITSDEEIKLNDYITDGYIVWKWEDDSSLLGRKKIILTTDQDLISDGVQKIDDNFLEWFVKNPSCESVEIQGKNFSHDKNILHIEYKIIIQQEERDEYFKHLEKDKQELGEEWEKVKKEFGFGKNQETVEIPQEELKQETDDEEKEFRRKFPKEFALIDMIKLDEAQEKPKQETLEAAAWKYNPLNKLDGEFIRHAFIEGAKYQAERSFSEEEILVLLQKRDKHNMDNLDAFDGWKTPKEWFEKLKINSMKSFKNTRVEGVHYDVIPQSEISKINKEISEDSTLNVNYKPERIYSEEDMNEFAWYFHTHLRQFTDDKQALDKGMYLKMWLKNK
jgi:hypothetical protein